MRGKWYQIALIGLGVVSTAFLGVFFYREIFPEYRMYQDDYIKLEEFRASYTGSPPAPFKVGVKQIVLEKEDLGNPTIDRCLSCHVALQVEAYSPTAIARDVNGHAILDASGVPLKISNKEYIWKKLDEKIAALTDENTNQALRDKGKNSEVKARLRQADQLLALKTAHVKGKSYDVTNVLRMHPLIGKETRPFEFHPIDDYGCTSCHNGNGRGLTTETAHGPVFDGQYEEEFRGFVPKFTETDEANDPAFAKMFNAKPGHELLFQTNPIFIGALNEITSKTDWIIGHSHISLFGTFTLFAIAGIYQAIPVITKKHLWSIRLADWHFSLTLWGSLLFILSLWIGGFWQGMMWAEWANGTTYAEYHRNLTDFNFLDTVSEMYWFWVLRGIGGLIILIANLLFVFNMYNTIILQPKTLKSEFETGVATA